MKRKPINTAFETVILLLAIVACVLFFLALVSMLVGCSQDDDVQVPPEVTEVVNKQTFQMPVGNDQREYLMYIPTGYDADFKVPLVFHLHGGSGTGEKHYNISGWNDVAEANGFLMAYPTAWEYDKNKNGCGGGILVTSWNDYEMVDEVCPSETLKDDVAFFDQMIDDIGTNFSVDTTMIYISGFSNGGGMASRLAVELSDRLAAVASMSGTFRDTTASYLPKRVLPIQIMGGTADEGFAGATGFPDNQLPMDLQAVLDDSYINALMTIWINTMDLDPDYQITDDAGNEVTATFYGTSGDPDHLMRFTLLEDVGHVFYNPDDGPGAAEIFWEFFKSYKLK